MADADEQVLDETAAELAAVESALERLDDGTYGTCVVCGATLDEHGLASDPLLERCAAHR